MNPDNFQPSLQAHCQAQPEGYFAFIPPPLPPVLPMNWELASLLSEADRAVAELSGAGRLLPNPHLLIRPYLRREAVLSSLIEDTYAEVDELLFLEAEPTSPPARSAIKEVANHVRALEEGIAKLGDLPISTRLITDLHAILLSAVRGGEGSKTPGELRLSQNWIGGPGSNLQTATFVPPPPHQIHQCLQDWENYLHADSQEPHLIKAALLHYQFEAIHPFLDGNGRIGRLLITLYLCASGMLSQPLLFLSSYFEKYQSEYYHHLFTISSQGKWQEWLEYFLIGVRETAQTSLADTNALVDSYQGFRAVMDREKRVPGAAAGVLDSIFGTPMLSVTRHAESTGNTYANVAKAVAFWEKHGLLTEITNQRRNKIYSAPGVIDLTRPRPSRITH
jgi:Fic family protein